MEAQKPQKHSKADLTQGTIWKTIVLFTLPILLSQLLQTFYGVVDGAICGHTLSASEVAGVGDTSSISFIFLQFAFGCTAGMSVIISNRVGHGDMAGARKAFATQIVLGLILCAVVTAVSLVCIDPLLGIIGVAPSNDAVEQEVYTAAHTYITIICGGMVAQFFYNSIVCILRSVGDSLTPLLFLILSTVLNFALDLLMIVCFGWGVAGAAAATVISQAVSAVGCFIYTFIRYRELRPRAADFRAMNLRASLRTLWQGVPLGLQFSVLAFGLITMANGVISFDRRPDGSMVTGTPAQVGYGAACRIDNIAMAPFNALGTAMISFCGQNDGAGKHDRIRRGCNQALVIMLIIYLIDLAILLPLTVGGAYQYIFLSKNTVTAETIRFGNTYMYSAVPLLFLLGALYVFRNCVQGRGKPLFPFLAGIAELIARIAICLVLPRLVNGGPIDSEASVISFFCLGLADAGAWLAADILLLIATIRHVYLYKPRAVVAEMPAAALPLSDTDTPAEVAPPEEAAATSEDANRKET